MSSTPVVPCWRQIPLGPAASLGPGRGTCGSRGLGAGLIRPSLGRGRGAEGVEASPRVGVAIRPAYGRAGPGSRGLGLGPGLQSLVY